MRRALLILGACLAVTGCAESSSGKPSDPPFEKHIHLTDGRDLLCVIISDHHDVGGVTNWSCDWNNAH